MTNVINITKESGIPLIGLAFIGIIARNSNNLIQVRTTTLCNMNCQFCSTDAGIISKFHKTQYIVDLEYMLEYLRELANYFDKDLKIHIDSVGEPTAYPKLINLIKGIRKIKNYKDISMVTNGTLLTKEKIKELEEAGLTRINLSIHSLNILKSQELFGSTIYNIKKIIDTAKELDCKIIIQKYEHHKYGRKIKIKEPTYFNFYNKLKELEKKHNIKLRYAYSELETEKVKSLPVKFKKNEKVSVEIKAPGWFENQSIAVSRNRALTIINHKYNKNENMKVRILSTKDNVYLTEPVKQ